MVSGHAPIHHTPVSKKYLLTLDTRLHEPIKGLQGGRLLLRMHMSTCPTDIRLHEPIEGLQGDHTLLRMNMYVRSTDTRLHAAI